MCKQLKCQHCLSDNDHKNNAVHQAMESRQFAALFKDTLHQKISEAKSKIANTIREV